MDDPIASDRAGGGFGIAIVILITLLRIGLVVLTFLVAAGVIAGQAFTDIVTVPISQVDPAQAWLARIILSLILVASVLSVAGLLRRTQWGWTLGIVSAGGILFVNLITWATGDVHYLSMLLNSVVVLYLNQRDVRAALGVAG